MNPIEEQLWNYIDGNLTATENEVIAEKIKNNLQYHSLYQELLAVNQTLSQIDFEEPSMSFTRNVMEKVNEELPPVALKTKIDRRIIYLIGSLFGISILGIFGYSIFLSWETFQLPKLNLNLSSLVTPVSIMIFVLIDVALALVYLDGYLRRKNKAIR